MSYLKLSHLLKESSFVLTIFVSGFQKIATPELASQPKKERKKQAFQTRFVSCNEGTDQYDVGIKQFSHVSFV